MERKHLLKQLIESAKQSSDLNKYYIGTGNPNADILIIGKEPAIDKKNTEQHKIEILNNVENWDRDLQKNQVEIDNWNENNYSPLYPYKGQILKINKTNTNNVGTSQTWCNYQKLANMIYGNENNTFIDFHEKIFLTELSSIPNKNTKDAKKDAKFKEEIEFRKEVLKSEFFDSFRIVIVNACDKEYITGESLCETFGVQFPKVGGQHDFFHNNTKQSYWIHNSIKVTPKLVIHTRQLSNFVLSDLIDGIANEVKNSGLLELK